MNGNVMLETRHEALL